MSPRADRLHPEAPASDPRTPSQRDRDRIIHTYALRRLAGVTQVVDPSEGQLFHNRLTHTLEVAQIARRLGERLAREHARDVELHRGLDPEVVEAAALAHDLGHPPFGHVAESELNQLARDHGLTDGFEGNAQSFRIVTKIAAHRPGYRGLNLTRATLNAILKYPWQHRSRPQERKFGAYESESAEFRFARDGAAGGRSLESEVMDFADDVAYSVHDVDDFIRAGLLHVEYLRLSASRLRQFLVAWARESGVDEAALLAREDRFRRLMEVVGGDSPYSGTHGERALRRMASANLIRRYVTGVRVRRPAPGQDALRINEAHRWQLRFLKRLIWVFVIRNPRLASQQAGQRQIIRSLFDRYLDAIRRKDADFLPSLYHDELRELPRSRGRRPSPDEVRLAVDVVASMTDAQAARMYRRLAGVETGSILEHMEG